MPAWWSACSPRPIMGSAGPAIGWTWPATAKTKEVPLVPPEAVEEAKKKQTDQEKKRKAPLNIPAIHALEEGPKPANMRVHLRGDPNTLGDEAPRRFLSVLGGQTFSHGSGR